MANGERSEAGGERASRYGERGAERPASSEVTGVSEANDRGPDEEVESSEIRAERSLDTARGPRYSDPRTSESWSGGPAAMDLLLLLRGGLVGGPESLDQPSDRELNPHAPREEGDGQEGDAENDTRLVEREQARAAQP